MVCPEQAEFNMCSPQVAADATRNKAGGKTGTHEWDIICH
jgi:hypothetical protein